VIVRKAYKYRLKTNDDIEQKLWAFAGHSRFVWNYFWRLNKHRLSNGYRVMRYSEMDYFSKLLKKSDEYSFLAEAPAHLIQQKLKDLDKAYKDAFDKKQQNKRMPTKRKRNIHSSFRYPAPNQLKLDNRRIFLPKLGWIGFYSSRKIDGEIKNATVSYSGGHWYISIQIEKEISINEYREPNDIGIDLGISKFVSLSNGEQKLPKNSFKTNQIKLAKEQRKLSKKVKFSSNWQQQKRKITQLHSKIANTRKDYIHKVSNEICKNHTRIFIEDLKIANMSKSAKGTIENKGKNVKAKSGLNKAILDQGWYEFGRQLEYKSAWNGGEVIRVNPRYTSQTCSNCSYKDRDNRLSQAKFECKACGHKENADINAAKNILVVGQTMLACGVDTLVATMKQESVRNREIVLP
jgi:IS605 OrfB family transposase|tara:strand:+ start:497 stop:1714 length:1218 start_codon:yes stop_codon:yes gene_type:complete